MLLNNWTKLSHSSRNSMLTALVVIAAIGLYNWIVAPHRSELLAAQNHESVMNNLVTKNKSVGSDIVIKKKKLKELRDKLRQAHVELFDPVQARKFFSEIKLLARQHRCELSSSNFLPAGSKLKTGRPQRRGDVTINRATISIVGAYGNLVALINKLQDRAQRVRLDSISIRPGSDGSGRVECDAAITVYVAHKKGEMLQ